MLDQEPAVERGRRKASPVRVQIVVSQKLIADLRRKGFLSNDTVFSRESIGQAVLRACLVAVKVTEV